MKTYMQLVEAILQDISEVFPWDVEGKLKDYAAIIDIREPYEFESMHIKGSINIPRGVLESACEWNYEETEPKLVQARDQKVLVICRSGHRSALAVHVMQQLGFDHAISLKTGLRGWFDFEQPLVDHKGLPVDEETADNFFESHVKAHQLAP
jgi:rhodanese-related sulfurtransferase